METTITFKGIELTVEGNYELGENEIRYYPDMSGHPGSPSSFDINGVFIADVDIYELLSWEDLEQIEELVIENIEG